MTLTSDELFELAEMCWEHADRNDYDKEYYGKYMALSEKLMRLSKHAQDMEEAQ